VIQCPSDHVVIWEQSRSGCDQVHPRLNNCLVPSIHVVLHNIKVIVITIRTVTSPAFRMFEIDDQVDTEPLVRGEVSETLSEPCAATSTFSFAALLGAIAEACCFSLLQ